MAQPFELGSASQRQRMNESIDCSGSQVRTSFGCEDALPVLALTPVLVGAFTFPCATASDTDPLYGKSADGSVASPFTRTSVSFTNLSFPPLISHTSPKRADAVSEGEMRSPVVPPRTKTSNEPSMTAQPCVPTLDHESFDCSLELICGGFAVIDPAGVTGAGCSGRAGCAVLPELPVKKSASPCSMRLTRFMPLCRNPPDCADALGCGALGADGACGG